jgi:hypothetical protein
MSSLGVVPVVAVSHSSKYFVIAQDAALDAKLHASSWADGGASYLMVLLVLRRIHWGMGRFCFCALASFCLVRKDFWLCDKSQKCMLAAFRIDRECARTGIVTALAAVVGRRSCCRWVREYCKPSDRWCVACAVPSRKSGLSLFGATSATSSKTPMWRQQTSLQFDGIGCCTRTSMQSF